MTPTQLEQQSRDAVIAYLQDSSVRLEQSSRLVIEWADKKNNNAFCLDSYYYRIAQPKPWYRVAIMGGYIALATDRNTEDIIKNSEYFIKWLTERIEYDN